EYGSRMLVDNNEAVRAETVLVTWDPSNRLILTERAGKIRLIDLVDNVTVQETQNAATKVRNVVVLDYKGDKYQPAVSIVDAGDAITPGAFVPQDLLRIMGVAVVQKYLLNQIQEIYRHQGVNINDRHVELIVRQMLRKARIVDPGDSDFLIGDRVDKMHLEEI